jgi:hypothetical protein
MTLEQVFIGLNQHSLLVSLVILAAPWLIWVFCDLIPGQKEEPFVLSINISLAVFCLALWAGYLGYATNTAGWEKVIKEANALLLMMPPYYILMSLWVARQRMPLSQVPACRTLQGLAIMIGVYLFLAWLGNRVRIVFFSYLPITVFLWLLVGVLAIGYVGYRRAVGTPNRRQSYE